MKKAISLIIFITIIVFSLNCFAEPELSSCSLLWLTSLPQNSSDIFSSAEDRAYLTLAATYSIGITTNEMIYIMNNLDYLWAENHSLVARTEDSLVILAFSTDSILEIHYYNPEGDYKMPTYRIISSDLSGEELEASFLSMAEQFGEYYINDAESLLAAQQRLAKAIN